MLVEYFTGFSLYSRIIENFFNYQAFAGGPHRLSGPFKRCSKIWNLPSLFFIPSINRYYKNNKEQIYKFFFINFWIYISNNQCCINFWQWT